MYISPNGGGVIGGRHVVTLAATGTSFSTALPASLYGVVTPEEFAASVRRCNDAFQAGPLWLARLLVFGGFVAWIALIITSFSQVGSGPSPAFIGIAFAVFVVCILTGSLWQQAIVRGRVQKLQNAVAHENDVYNSPARRAARPNQPPMSWSLIITSTGWYYRRNTLLCQINIEIGGPDLQQPIVIIAPQLNQPQPPPPAYQPYSGQAFHAPYAQPAYGIPVSGGQPGGPVVYQPQPHPSPAWVAPPEDRNSTAEGFVHATPIPAIATCTRCGRTSANPEDRFCAACGGQFLR